MVSSIMPCIDSCFYVIVQITKCTPAKAKIITQYYPTMASLLAKYKQLYSTKEKEDLLKNLCDEQHNNKIGPALSRDIYHLLCDL